MKLSAAQLRVLKAMAEGWKACHGSGSTFLFRHSPAGLGRCAGRTFRVLYDAGLVECCFRGIGYGHYTLTDAGRAALAEQEGGK